MGHHDTQDEDFFVVVWQQRISIPYHTTIPVPLVRVCGTRLICPLNDLSAHPLTSMNQDSLFVLVTAHPDDESMFFVPTIRALQRHPRQTVWLICLTTGDYDGLGKIRSKELQQTALNVLEIDKVLLCDHAEVRDDPRQAWDISTASRLISSTLQKALEKETTKYNHLTIISFDECGVSGHVNHRDTYLACRYLCLHGDAKVFQPLPTLDLWCLVSDQLPIVKFLPLRAWFLLLLTCCGIVDVGFSTNSKANVCIHRLQHPSLNWNAMASHASQFVWYRRLFVIFSSYTYVNKLKKQKPR